MGLYLVLASGDLRAAVSVTCTSFYMPFDQLAVVSYAGSADELTPRATLRHVDYLCCLVTPTSSQDGTATCKPTCFKPRRDIQKSVSTALRG